MAKQFEKIPARFKASSDDFIVEEKAWDWQCKISEEDIFGQKPDLSKLEPNEHREFLLCEFEKKDIDTFRAKKEFASQIGKGLDALGFAGIKDKKAHTVQRISIFNPDMEKIKNFKHPNIYIKNFSWGKRKIKLGYLEGNKFTIIIRDIDPKDATKVTNKIRKTDNFANYFGNQRFGSVRGNNAKVGYLIVKKKYKEALDAILMDLSDKEREEVTNARKKLNEEKNYDEALEYFPMYLKQERRILSYLIENKHDYIGAIKRGERKQFLFYIHALQSKIFNEILEMALAERIDFTKKGQQKIPLFGYRSNIDEDKLGEIEEDILFSNNLQPEEFKNADISYLSLKGELRNALISVSDIEAEIEDDEEYEGTKKIKLTFSLPSGVYATTFLSNFFDLIEERD